MRFSERQGHTQPRTVIQTECVDNATRSALWNALDLAVWGPFGFKSDELRRWSGRVDEFTVRFWDEILETPFDERPNRARQMLAIIRNHFFESEWYAVYDFLEFVLKQVPYQNLDRRLNLVLERTLAGYRILAGKVTPIIDESELRSVEHALDSQPFRGAALHIQTALSMMSRRDNPDYRNSIKESVSAVESAARELTNNPKATLGDALATLERGRKLHGALKQGFACIYGYTSDENGIRHSMLEEPRIECHDAQFFLVACSSFVNYLAACQASASAEAAG